jgi:hypothetical protein
MLAFIIWVTLFSCLIYVHLLVGGYLMSRLERGVKPFTVVNGGFLWGAVSTLTACLLPSFSIWLASFY